MMECDTFLMLGSGFPYSEFLPKEGQARGVQVDIDPGMLSIRYPMEVNLTGDVKSTLEALLPLLRAKTDGSWRESIKSWNDDWQQVLTERAHAKANRSEEHTSELQSLMRISYAVFCLKKTKKQQIKRK